MPLNSGTSEARTLRLRGPIVFALNSVSGTKQLCDYRGHLTSPAGFSLLSISSYVYFPKLLCGLNEGAFVKHLERVR